MSVLVIDFGSQYTQLIARRLRELGYFSELLPYTTSLATIRSKKPSGVILSGGPQSVYEEGSLSIDIKQLAEIAPIMGICYGMQLISLQLGGQVNPSDHHEYGYEVLNWKEPWVEGLQRQQVWMSHGDVVTMAPPDFAVVARSETGLIAAIEGPGVIAVQFHPEVTHTEQGQDVLTYFLKTVCRTEPNWRSEDRLSYLVRNVQRQVPDGERVLLALSGGVDSSVVAALLQGALGRDRVIPVLVDNGLLRKNEVDDILAEYDRWGLAVHVVDAEEEFLKALEGVVDPEHKRKTIGRLFIEIFEREVDKLGPFHWLAQGTLYPDVIESVSPRGGSVTIKSHHNVGGLPERMKLKLLEPLRDCFKDEVRVLGRELGLPPAVIDRHPFPGPGLAVRVLGAIDKQSLDLLRACDEVFISLLRERELYHKIWQAFCVLLPVRSVGVQGDGRTFQKVVALRAVTSVDGMTADWYPFSGEFLREVSNAITNRVKGVNRVVYDVTSKPPGTIEWE